MTQSAARSHFEYRSPYRKHDRTYFYKYVNAEVAKIILATRKLRWSSPLLFNDPFDLPEDLPLTFDASQLHLAVTEQFLTVIQEPDQAIWGQPFLQQANYIAKHLPPAVRKDIAESIKKRIPAVTPQAKMSLDMFKEFWKEQVRNFRVICLAELNDVTTMWTYYSDNHRGVVLEFEAVDALDSVFIGARRVTYQDEPPVAITLEAWIQALSGTGDSFAKMFIEDYPYFKTTDWAHEREWRLASFKRPGEEGLFSDYGFHERELTRVFFGLYVDEHDKLDILNLLSHGLEHVAPFQAFAESSKARITFRPLKN